MALSDRSMPIRVLSYLARVGPSTHVLLVEKLHANPKHLRHTIQSLVKRQSIEGKHVALHGDDGRVIGAQKLYTITPMGHVHLRKHNAEVGRQNAITSIPLHPVPVVAEVMQRVPNSVFQLGQKHG